MKGDPLRSQNHDELKSSTVGPTNNFFFQEQKIFFQGTTFDQFFVYYKAKKKFRSDLEIFENFDFQKS